VNGITIRGATDDDLVAVTSIYNASIATTTSWSEVQQTLDERREWFAERTANGEGVFVAAKTNGGEVVGFAAYGEFRDNTLWPCYRFTAEHSVHVRDRWHGRGIGRLLMTALFAHAADHGIHMMVGAVDSENVGSIRFHEALGFVEVGRLPEVGRKFDRWLDLVLLQRTIETVRDISTRPVL
jgi:L-amino acid N-acyltransferase YncA